MSLQEKIKKKTGFVIFLIKLLMHQNVATCKAGVK